MTDKLSRNQYKALKALLQCPSVAAAARSCGLGERTLWRYLEGSAFRAELSKQQDGLVAAVTASLVGLGGDAVTVLHEALTDKNTSVNIKTRVARDWLAQMGKSVELADLAHRLDVLEETLGQ